MDPPYAPHTSPRRARGVGGGQPPPGWARASPALGGSDRLARASPGVEGPTCHRPRAVGAAPASCSEGAGTRGRARPSTRSRLGRRSRRCCGSSQPPGRGMGLRRRWRGARDLATGSNSSAGAPPGSRNGRGGTARGVRSCSQAPKPLDRTPSNPPDVLGQSLQVKSSLRGGANLPTQRAAGVASSDSGVPSFKSCTRKAARSTRTWLRPPAAHTPITYIKPSQASKARRW